MKLTELESLAKAAMKQCNSDFICAANPETILRLIELVREMESALKLIASDYAANDYPGDAMCAVRGLAKLKEFEDETNP